MSTWPPRVRSGHASPTPVSCCVSTERIYVAEPLLRPFTAALAARARALRLGNALDYDHDMGGLINRRQLDRVSGARRGRRGQGGDGAHRRPAAVRISGELFYEPTVLTGVTRRWHATPTRLRAGGQRLPGAGDWEAVGSGNDSATG